MQFLAYTVRRTEAFTAQQFDDVLEAEAERARTLFALGDFRQIWSRGDVPGAVILLEAPSFADAEEMIESLPLKQREMMDVTIVPLGPYRGFGPRKPL
jgi:muconolactone delta-isomerase